MGRDIQDYCLSVLDVLNNKFFREINVFSGAICGQIQRISEFTIKAEVNWASTRNCTREDLLLTSPGMSTMLKWAWSGFRTLICSRCRRSCGIRGGL